MGSIQPPHDCSGNLDKKERLHGSVEGIITCAEAEVGEHSPSQQTKHIFLAGCWRRGARDQPGPTKALPPTWHISVLIHLTVQVWPGAGGSAAAKRFVMLRLPSWGGLGAHEGLLTCTLHPQELLSSVPALPMAERDETSWGRHPGQEQASPPPWGSKDCLEPWAAY